MFHYFFERPHLKREYKMFLVHIFKGHQTGFGGTPNKAQDTISAGIYFTVLSLALWCLLWTRYHGPDMSGDAPVGPPNNALKEHIKHTF